MIKLLSIASVAFWKAKAKKKKRKKNILIIICKEASQNVNSKANCERPIRLVQIESLTETEKRLWLPSKLNAFKVNSGQSGGSVLTRRTRKASGNETKSLQQACWKRSGGKRQRGDKCCLGHVKSGSRGATSLVCTMSRCWTCRLVWACKKERERLCSADVAFHTLPPGKSLSRSLVIWRTYQWENGRSGRLERFHYVASVNKGSVSAPHLGNHWAPPPTTSLQFSPWHTALAVTTPRDSPFIRQFVSSARLGQRWNGEPVTLNQGSQARCPQVWAKNSTFQHRWASAEMPFCRTLLGHYQYCSFRTISHSGV